MSRMEPSFETLITKLEARLAEPLPGAAAHEPLRAVRSNGEAIQFKHSLPPRPGSVLILLYPDDHGAIHFPLIKRPDYAGTHSGQVSFPGGKAEAGENYLETALREAEEEVGVHPRDVQVLGRLSDFFVVPSNFMVTPVLGYTTKRPEFKADQHEVVRIFEGKLLDILPQSAIQVSEITVATTYKLRAPHFLIDREIVWGATAMMLNELREIVLEL